MENELLKRVYALENQIENLMFDSNDAKDKMFDKKWKKPIHRLMKIWIPDNILLGTHKNLNI